MTELLRGSIPAPAPNPPSGYSHRRQRAKIAEAFVRASALLGEKLGPENAMEVARKLLSALHLSANRIPTRALEMSLSRLHGTELNEGTIHGLLLWTLENMPYLRAGQVIPTWTGEVPVWTCVRITDGVVEQVREFPVMRLMMRCYAGVLAGMFVELSVSPKYARWLLKEIGYPKYARAHENEIVGSIFWALLGIGDRRRPQLLRVEIGSGMLNENKQLFRDRASKRCSQPVPCHACHMTTGQCGLACRG